MALNYVAAALSLFAAAVLISGLIRIVSKMRVVVRDLNTVRLLMRSIANQTEPVAGWVGQIGDNVASLASATDDLANRTRVGVAAATRRGLTDPLYPPTTRPDAAHE